MVHTRMFSYVINNIRSGKEYHRSTNTTEEPNKMWKIPFMRFFTGYLEVC